VITSAQINSLPPFDGLNKTLMFDVAEGFVLLGYDVMLLGHRGSLHFETM
jgi:hypothetical protein